MKGDQSLLFIIFFFFFSFVCGQVSMEEAFPHADKQALRKISSIDVFANQQIEYAPPLFYNLSAACAPIPIPPDTDNVNNLRPGNIKVVMAMGDSITAAMSAKDTTFLSMKEYRGLAYSIGGDSGVTTMPNLLKTYSPSGYPIGPSTGVGKREMSTNGLNAAVSGAINQDMLSQAQWLVAQLKANKNINFEEDWKLLTIWIGSNNLCDVCKDNGYNNADSFQKLVTEALEYLYANVPRVFVNLLVNLDITQLDDITEGMCGMLHSIACGCVVSDRSLVYEANLEYQVRANAIAQTFASRNNPSFAVVVQPFLEQTTIDARKELSAADCFHPSALSHSVASVALWNNMITPAAQKKRAWSFDETPICATADTLLYTN
eukprot:Phypoly_transcript_11095.p1 GENE.Phypoly_transcript_11095~~Phypoly_transcript_11095.p1  ORF type:complete len:376 (+),score=74.04 Phypoly_transcript_11095:48-1175(+)